MSYSSLENNIFVSQTIIINEDQRLEIFAALFLKDCRIWVKERVKKDKLFIKINYFYEYCGYNTKSFRNIKSSIKQYPWKEIFIPLIFGFRFFFFFKTNFIQDVWIGMP